MKNSANSLQSWSAIGWPSSGPRAAPSLLRKTRRSGRKKGRARQSLRSVLLPRSRLRRGLRRRQRRRERNPRACALQPPAMPGLELETPSLVPVKKNVSAVVVSDKYNLKPIPLKRQSSSPNPGAVVPPAEKKYKPLNTTPNTTKEIKVKIIPPQPVEGLGFLDALNSAPVPGIKIKKKKKVLSPTVAKLSLFEAKPRTGPSTAKPSSTEPGTASEPMDLERPGTPVPPIEVLELTDTASRDTRASDSKLMESPGGPAQFTRKGHKRKTVTWAEEGKLHEYFYFELDETERVNVNKIKDFGEAAKREMLKDRHAFETARRLSHDAMEEKVPWMSPQPLSLPRALVIPGSNSQECFVQAKREKGILQEIFLSKESVPDSPHEPDPETYEHIPPKLIPQDEECSVDEAPYGEGLEGSGVGHSPSGVGSSKLPPVLANLMGSMGASKSPQGQGAATSINMQEILTSIMGGPNSHPSEELLKEPDYSDKIKQLLRNLQPQGPRGVPHSLLGPAPMANGFPPAGLGGPGGPKDMQHFLPGPGGPMPGPHGSPGGPGGPVGPRLMGPPDLPPRGGNPFWDTPGDPMWGGPIRGGLPGPYHWGRGGRGGNEPPPPSPFRGGRGGRSGGGPLNGRGGPSGGMGGDGHRPHDGHVHGHGPPGHRGHNHRVPHPHDHRGHDGPGHGSSHRGHDSGHGHGGDMSSRPICRHFMMKGSCRYENNCAFYHPGVNGPPLP
ncbi:serine/threonine-protein phosphatase 1 regulatory subunit 10 isoform X2 [Tachyglossus aculeatus]|uniref:serine/threonine-protein phosphatase 1 regulatory subunit 10 isoform X2 n=1 Tax=Tachyglossus aculeatus TaxID=9261 RepID=UPI0018F2FF01|nr:serine/threonine-protein phosphatase 1 regulatory subunit 10 isoform X2 [Tachyglossus aculeatus]